MIDKPVESDKGSKAGDSVGKLYQDMRPGGDSHGPQPEKVRTNDNAEMGVGREKNAKLIEDFRPGETAEKPDVEGRKHLGEGGIPEKDALSKAGEVPDKGDLTRAGYEFQKHGNRRPEVWGKPEGNQEALNKSGQERLDNIINSPDTEWQIRQTGRFGTVVEGQLPDERGARWSLDGKRMECFLDPPRHRS